MIRYTLACDRQHTFESWFQNSDAYDKQARELVAMFEQNFQQFADAAAKEIQEVALKVAN